MEPMLISLSRSNVHPSDRGILTIAKVTKICQGYDYYQIASSNTFLVRYYEGLIYIYIYIYIYNISIYKSNT